MAGSNGGGFLNSNAGNILSGTLIKPEHVASAVRNNPWIIPAAAAAATVFTGGAAAPALAGAMGAGEAGAAAGMGAAAGGAAAGGAAAGMGAEAAGGAAAGMGADAALGASAGSATSGLLGDAMAPIAEDAPIGLDSPFATMGPGVNPYQGGSSLLHAPSSSQMTNMGMKMMNQSIQPQTPNPGGMRPPSMGNGNQMQQPANPFAMNQPMGQAQAPGAYGGMMNKPITGTGGMADVLKRMGLLGGMQ